MSRRIPFLFAVLLLAGCNVVWTDGSSAPNDWYESVCSRCNQSSCTCRSESRSEKKHSSPERSAGNYRKK